MVDLMSLWLPILLSTAALFFLSFLAWMVLPHHKKDWNGLPDEAAFGKAVSDLNLQPGNYSFPYFESNEEMKSPEFLQRQQQGPNGTLQLWNGPCNMGKCLFCQFTFFLVTNFCLAYLATMGVQAGANFMQVFRFVGTAGILTYTAASVPGSIWFNLRLPGYIVDGLMYGLATGAVFACFWPAASGG